MPPSSFSSSWRGLPVILGPLEGTILSSSPPLEPTTSSSPWDPRPPLPLRGRRPTRVLYPPYLTRRPLPRREAPDPARRWLLLLLALLFLQIYTEEAGVCSTEQLQQQSHSPDTSSSLLSQEGEGSLGAVRPGGGGGATDDQWQALQTVAGSPLECVVA